jgi:GTP-binding protein
LAAYAKRRKLPFHAISAVTGEGIEPLRYAISELVAAHRPAPIDLGEPNSSTPVSGRPFKHKPAYPPPAPHARGRAR